MQTPISKVATHNVQAVTPVNPISQTTQLKTDIRNLKEGFVFQGEVKDIRRDEVTIELSAKQVLIAKILENVELTIGQRLTFMIKENTGEHIILKAVHSEKNPLTQDATLIRALEAANLIVNEKTIELVKELMKQQMPIDKQSLQKITHQLLSNSNADVETIVMMNKHNIPVTKENVQQFMNYKNFEHRISNEIETMTKQISEELSKLIESPDTQKATDLNSKLTTILTLDSSEFDKLSKFSVGNSLTKQEVIKLIDHLRNVDLPEDIKEALKVISKNEQSGSVDKPTNTQDTNTTTPQSMPLELQQEIKDMLSSTRLTTGRLLQGINYSIKEALFNDSSIIKQEITQLLNSPEYKKLMSEHIKNQLFLQPEEVAKENTVSKLYDKLETQLKQIRTVLEDTLNPESKLLGTTKGLQENIDFMKTLNQIFTYIQIPLRLKNQNTTSELYVFTDKEALKKNKNNISALLHLDLASLGILDIHINKQENNIQGKFYSENEGIRELLNENLNKLIAPLESKGYNIYTQVTHREEKFEFVKDFINLGGEELSPKRYSFDVRA